MRIEMQRVGSWSWGNITAEKQHFGVWLWDTLTIGFASFPGNRLVMNT